MFWRKKKSGIVNLVPEGYEFSRPYVITVEYNTSRYLDETWRAEIQGFLGFYYAQTKEEAIIRAQNSAYRADLEKRIVDANPSETFTIPPIRKFNE